MILSLSLFYKIIIISEYSMRVEFHLVISKLFHQFRFTRLFIIMDFSFRFPILFSIPLGIIISLFRCTNNVILINVGHGCLRKLMFPNVKSAKFISSLWKKKKRDTTGVSCENICSTYFRETERIIMKIQRQNFTEINFIPVL